MAIRLLLADDSITIHKVVSLTFADEDVQVEAVTNGDAALEKVRADRPDVVLADVFMPGKNGYEVCDSIKSDPELGHTPVVLLVGTFEPFDEAEASRVRCDAHLTKPFDTSELIKLIHDLAPGNEIPAAVPAPTPVPEAPVLSATAAGAAAEPQPAGLISPRTRESFLGESHILDIFEFSPAPVTAGVVHGGSVGPPAPGWPEAASRPVIPFPDRARAPEDAPASMPLPEETINLIVEKVVKRMSENVVREVAWEVVPALSEIMIRQYLEELRSDRKS